MPAKIIFITGVLGIGVYVTNTVMNYDPNMYPFPIAQVTEQLSNAESTFPQRFGGGTTVISSGGKTANGLILKSRSSSGRSSAECEVIIEEKEPAKTYVALNCGDPNAGDELDKLTLQIKTVAFDEHIQAAMSNREFNADAVKNRIAGLAVANLGKIQSGVSARMDEAIKTQNQYASKQY